ncbi:MAG: tetratricopeptide repeat protein [Oceanospirillaceae bacterium]|nr:tetratricopeptide repeat protein [Oceanospirillaceae bacterium]
MDFKRTRLTVLITAIIATGCSANKLESNTDTQGYCRNGGESSDYSCDTNSKNPTANPNITASNPNTEAWMNSKLSDIKSWLKTIKENPNAAITSTNSSNSALLVRNPAATQPELIRIEALTERGDHRIAMASINNFLSQHPNNLEAELTKGLILNNMGENKEAEALLRSAITRHPTSPELYNNLAVIYSNQGDYGKAIETLLLAFSTHPSYAQVNENLREVYASVASLAYNRALDLDSDKKLTPNLVVLRRTSAPSLPAATHESLSTGIAANNSSKTKPAVIVTPTSSKPVAASTTPTVLIAQTKKKVDLPIPTIIEADIAVDIAEVRIKPQQPVVPEKVTKSVVRVDQTSQTKTAKAPGSATLAAIKAVNRWGWTWTSQNVSAYLGSYINNYTPKASMKHSQWRAIRTARLTKPSFIKVRLSKMKSKRIANNLIEVTFLQKYQANTYKDQTYKRLTMKKVGGKWLISKEQNI